MASAIFQEIRSSATGALDKARLVLNPEAAAAADQNADEQQQQPDRLEELAEYCPKLSFQQVSINNENTRYGSFYTLGVRSSSHLSHLSHLFPQRLIGFATCFSLGCKLLLIRPIMLRPISNFRIVHDRIRD
jgi:hypothetical protein